MSLDNTGTACCDVPETSIFKTYLRMSQELVRKLYEVIVMHDDDGTLQISSWQPLHDTLSQDPN